MESAIGIALDGVLLFPSLRPVGTSFVDNWFPPNGETQSRLEVDQCFGSVTDAGEYIYMSASNCVYPYVPPEAGQDPVEDKL